jgi:CheY-like chemotaxis protein/tetratricopeptide (TPR) repeat protein
MKQQAPKARVLVVEDNQDVRNVVTVYLRSHGYLIDEAHDGVAAIEFLEHEQPDVILLDVLLPRLDGIETLRRLRKMPRCEAVPVIMMSAVLQIRDLQAETARLKVSSFLQKPFQMRKLVELVQKALDPQTAPAVKPRRPAPTKRVTTKRAPEPTATRLIHERRPLAESGALELMPLPEVIHAVFAENRTGRLRISSGTTEKRIYFQNGLPVFAESSLPEETLGAHLLARGRITPEQQARALDEMNRSGRLFGEALLMLNLIDPHELFTEIEAHLAEKVISSFGWFEGLYHFEADDSWKDDVIIARMKPGRILLDGVQRHWSAGEIHKHVRIDSHSTTFPLEGSPYSGDQLGLSTKETKILQLARRGHSVADIARQIADSRMVNTTLYGLWVMEYIGFTLAPARTQTQLDDVLAEDTEARISTPPKRADLENSLLAEYLRFRTADYFTLLGVSHEASTEELTAAFNARQQRYHPDALVGLETGLVHEKIEELYIRVHTAYRTLIDPVGRQGYIEKLERGAKGTLLSSRSPAPAPSPAASGKQNHELLFEKGFSLLRNGEYQLASELFTQADNLVPQPRYQGYRAWAVYLLDRNGQRADTEKTLRQLADENRDDPLFPHLLGNLYLREKKTKRAIDQFEAALKADPQHIDSARQLRILRMRMHTSESSGLFDIFKKKD